MRLEVCGSLGWIPIEALAYVVRMGSASSSAQGLLACPLSGWRGETGTGQCSAWHGRGWIHRLLLAVRQPPGDTGSRQSRGAVHAPRAQR